MGSYVSVAFNTIATLTNAPIFQLENKSSTEGLGVIGLGVVLADATAASTGLAFASVTGTSNGANDFHGADEGQAVGSASGLVSLTWTVAPTINSAFFMRKVPLPATAGAAVEWEWEENAPLIIIPGAAIVLWNYGANTNGVLACYVKWAQKSGVTGVFTQLPYQ